MTNAQCIGSTPGISSTFLTSFRVLKGLQTFYISLCFCNVAFFSCFAMKLSTEAGVHKPFRRVENEKAACQFSHLGWRGLPYDHFSLLKDIVGPFRRRERWSFASLIFSSLSSLWVNLSTYKIKKCYFTFTKPERSLRYLQWCPLLLNDANTNSREIQIRNKTLFKVKG